MLDENLRVLSRRINDMEVELTDKKEKIRNLEKANIDVQSRLDSIHDEHAYGHPPNLRGQACHGTLGGDSSSLTSLPKSTLPDHASYPQ